MNDNKVSISVRVSDEVSEYLRVMAFETRSSKSEYVKKLIEKDMEEKDGKANSN